MMDTFPPRTWLFFGLRFLALALLFVPVWWLMAPYYGWLLVQSCGLLLRDVWSMPLTAGHIEPQGILHTESVLVFYLGEQATRMQFVKLITNLPPFVALMLATPGLGARHRLIATLLGAALLCVGHVLFIVLALAFAPTLQRHTEIPTALAQFFLTLPFLLWIVLAYAHTLSKPRREKAAPQPRH